MLVSFVFASNCNFAWGLMISSFLLNVKYCLEERVLANTKCKLDNHRWASRRVYNLCVPEWPLIGLVRIRNVEFVLVCLGHLIHILWWSLYTIGIKRETIYADFAQHIWMYFLLFPVQFVSTYTKTQISHSSKIINKNIYIYFNHTNAFSKLLQ
jgi:hypothetical protein